VPLSVVERGRPLRFSFEEVLKYLARKDGRSPDEEATLDRLKQEMADRVMAAPADSVYDAA
jgi:hypothetical protein